MLYKYPIRKNKGNKVESLSSNSRGMNFENEIYRANKYYANNDIAYIYKKPTPIKVLKISNYGEKFVKKSHITSAVFEEKSTTDYNGIYKGMYIDFEAKETANKTFNISSNLHTHQREHLENIHKHGGISFLIIKMKYYNKIYIIDIEKILNYAKSTLSIEFIMKNGIEVKEKLYIDYLEAVDVLLDKRRDNVK